MKRVLELIMSLIATAATYALMHVVLFMDLFKFQHKLPVYVPTVIAVIVGLIFYFLLATPLAGLLLKRLNQTEERLSKMNLKELSLSVWRTSSAWHSMALAHWVRLSWCC